MFLPRFRLAAVATMILATSAIGAPIPGETKPAEGQANKAKKALTVVADFSFEQQSLADLITFVKEKGKVDVVLDANHLLQMGMDPTQTTVTVQMKGAKLRDGLRAALAPLNLKFGVVGGKIYVTTEEALISKQMRQRVTLESDGRSLASVLAGLAAETGANIVLDPRQAKKNGETPVTLNLDEVTLETAVRLAAEVGGLRAVRMGNVLFVTSDERAKVLRQDADGPTPAGNVTPFFPVDPIQPPIGIGGAAGGGVAPAVPGVEPAPEKPAAPAPDSAPAVAPVPAPVPGK